MGVGRRENVRERETERERERERERGWGSRQVRDKSNVMQRK